MNFVATFLETVFAFRSQPALRLIHKDDQTITEYTWIEYLQNALAVCHTLQKNQLIRPGQDNFFAVISLNRPESFFTLLGVIMAGGVPVPINVPLLKGEGQAELRAILDDCHPVAVLTNQGLSPHLPTIHHLLFEDLLTEGGSQYNSEKQKWIGPKIFKRLLSPARAAYLTTSPLDLLIMPYTSGTSGGAKGVMLSHRNVLDRASAIAHEFNIAYKDRVFSYLMLGHIAELVATFFSPAWTGNIVYFTDWAYELSLDREKFRPHFQPIMRAIQPTLFMAVPVIWKNLRKEIEKKLPAIVKILPASIKKALIGNRVREELGFTQTRHFISAAAKMEAKDFFLGLGIQLRDIYGQTETAGPLLIDGLPIGDVSVDLNLKTDEIELQGNCVMMGYYNQPHATAATWENQGQFNALYKTGDLGEYVWDEKNAEKWRINFVGRAGGGFKYGNGQFADSITVGKLETRAQSIMGVDAVIICGEGKSKIVALVFVSDTLDINAHFAIEEQVLKMGEGHHRIGHCLILSTERQLIKTATEKPKTKQIIKKLAFLLEKLDES